MSHHGKRLTSKPIDKVMGDYAQAIEAARSGLGIALWNPAIHALDALNGQLIALTELSCQARKDSSCCRSLARLIHRQ